MYKWRKDTDLGYVRLVPGFLRRMTDKIDTPVGLVKHTLYKVAICTMGMIDPGKGEKDGDLGYTWDSN